MLTLLGYLAITVPCWALVLPMFRDDRKPRLVVPEPFLDVPDYTFDHTGLV